MEIVQFDSKVSWTVVMACAFLNFLVLIPTKVSGLFFVEILDRYQVSRNLAGYPAFISTLMRCSGGPFAGYFAETFGINEVMILGSLLAAVGISACFFAEDIAVVIAFLGLIHGIGLAFTNTFFPQIATIHFRKHLTLAFGITQAGACLGSFLSPPLLLWIFRSYGTSGGFLIIGAMVLNGLPIVLILNILSPNRLYNKSGDSMKSKKGPERHLEMGVSTTINSFDGEDNNTANNVGDNKDVKTVEGSSDSEMRNSPEIKAVSALVLDKPTNDHTEVVSNWTDGAALNPSDELPFCNLSAKETGLESEKRSEHVFIGCEMISKVKPNGSLRERTTTSTFEKMSEIQNDSKEPIPVESKTNNYEENLLHSKHCTQSKTKYKLNPGISNKDLLKYREGEVEDCSSKDSPLIPVSNVSAPTYLMDQEGTQQQIKRENKEVDPTSPNALNARSFEYNEPNYQGKNLKDLKSDKKLTSRIANARKSLRIFLDVTFWIVIITQSLNVFILVIFWTTMIDFSRDKNIDRSKEVYLLMALPIAEIIGRLGLGWITDSKYLTRINFSILCFIGMGCSCSLMAWAQDFYIVMISIFVFGVISSGIITVFPIIVFEFFDTADQTMAQASKVCLFGPLSFLSGPLIGYFRGTLGSYAWLYHTTAMVSVACAALSALIPVLARMRDQQKKNMQR